MSKYREFAGYPNEVIYVAILPENIRMPMVDLIFNANRYRGEDHFDQFIVEWKQVYAYISELIREVKKHRSANQIDPALASNSLHALRYAANTLLNARQILQDKRRSTLHPKEA